MAENWKISGSTFETCNCEAACPCIFLSPPTTGECTALIAWHIDNGNLGDVSLDGLNVALAVHSPGHMAEVQWRAALYLDETGSQAQQDALTQVFSGQAGGHFAVLGEFMGEVLGVKSVAIDFQADGKRRSMRIPSIAEAEIEGLEGQGGAPVTVTNHPLAVIPGEPAVVAKSKKLSFHDHGLDWELSEKNAFYSPFTYQGP